MGCPNLTSAVCMTSSVGDRPYYPSAFQLRSYCNCASHKKCPFFVGFQLRQLQEPMGLDLTLIRNS